MRPEETSKCEMCKWQGKWDMMLLCAPKLAWEELLNWLLKHNTNEEEIIEIFVKEINKNLKNYDKTGSTK